MTPAELLEIYYHSKLRKWNATTLRDSKRNLSRFLEFLKAAGVTRAMAITALHLQNYRAHLDASKLSQNSIYDYLSVVCTWLRWAFLAGHLLEDPGREFKIKRSKAHTRFIPTQTQVQALLNIPSQRNRLDQRIRTAFELLYGTGLRRAELLKLNLQDIEHDPPGVWVRRGKGGKDRLQPLGDKLFGILTSYLEDTRALFSPGPGENALFLGLRGNRWSEIAFAKTFAFYAGRAGMPRLSPHGLRNAFATHLLENGAELHQVQFLLGHEDIRTTERYTQLHPLELQKIHRRFHPRAHRKTARG